MNHLMRWATSLPQPIAFVLSGGASLGAMQVGMLRALAQAGIEPDIIAGSSVGALNGAMVADMPLLEALEILQEIWLSLTRQDVFPGGRLSQAWQLAKTRNSLFHQNGLTDMAYRFLSVSNFEELRLLSVHWPQS